ncbi:hypothetical protein BKA63DRAFT_423848 [Paraphoma chrysanthemicola]|nr:hypothetical protein BKA63DRAFT_423848 [Paraphoma chrysanthemicola]
MLNTYGYKFLVTENHMTPDELLPLQFKYDVVGSEALTALDALFPPPPPRVGWYTKSTSENVQPYRDTYELLRDHHTNDPIMQTLWEEVNTVPSWVDWDQIKRGQEVFYRYAPGAIAGFAFQELLATTGSSYRPAETLVRTGGHSVKLAKHRLFETFQLMLQVTRSLDSVKPGGEGFASAVRVRLLHASVRNRILKLQSQRASYFDTGKFGVPINELDSMQSVCAFSTNLVWRTLPRQGIYVRHQEALDYIALWRWVGYILGTPYHILETPAKAHGAMESLMYACMAPSKNSRALAQNLLSALDGVSPLYAPKEFFIAGTRHINGDQICDEIGLSKPGLYWKAVILGQCWLLMLATYVGRSIPALDRWMVEQYRALFWAYIVEGTDTLNGGYKYDFKYVPHLDKQTGIEEVESNKIARATSVIEKIGLYSFIAIASIFGVIGSISVGIMLHYASRHWG